MALVSATYFCRDVTQISIGGFDFKAIKLVKNISLSFMESARVIRKFLAMLATISFASISANLCPMQFLPPAENGIKANLWRLLFASSSSHRSGRKSSGSVQWSGCLWIKWIGILMCVSGGIVYPFQVSCWELKRVITATGE